MVRGGARDANALGMVVAANCAEVLCRGWAEDAVHVPAAHYLGDQPGEAVQSARACRTYHPQTQVPPLTLILVPRKSTGTTASLPSSNSSTNSPRSSSARSNPPTPRSASSSSPPKSQTRAGPRSRSSRTSFTSRLSRYTKTRFRNRGRSSRRSG
jgi:hypothetical protein